MYDPPFPTGLLVFLIIIGTILSIFIARAIFSIPTIVKNLRAQTKLLNEIARAQGVDDETIRVINRDFDNFNR